MRVLHLSLGYNSTGADRCARELFEGLPGLGIETEMWTGEYRRDLPPGVSYLPRPWERFLFPLEAFPDLTDWRHRGSIAKLRAITKDQFDLVHLHNIHSGWISMKAMKAFTQRFPCVWTLHDEWAPNRGITYDLTGIKTPRQVKRLTHGLLRYIPYHRYHENFKWRRTRDFLKMWIPEPRIAICPSAYMERKTKASGIFARTEVIHITNGTKMPDVPNARMDRNDAKRFFGFSSDRPVVMMIATNLGDAHKGIGLGVRALKKIDPTLRIQALLVGRSAPRIQKELEPIESAAIVANDDMTLARAYRAADLMIIPSLGETLSYVALESMACGTPIIVFPIGGLPDNVGKNERGIVCSAVDTEEMAHRITELLSDDRLRAEMGARAAEWVRSTANMDNYLRKIVNVYTRVLTTSELIIRK